MNETTCLRRAVLFMPGDSLRKIEKAISLGVDSIVMDLEDGVALSQKDAARGTVLSALQTLDFGHCERLVRVNPVGSDLLMADLDATIAGRPDGYVIPKIDFDEQLHAVAEYLALEERRRGWPEGGIRLLPIVETALGVMNVREIALADPRVAALLFGAEDLAGDMGAIRTRASWEVFYARGALVTAAKACRIQAIDQVFFDLEDMAGFAAECQFGRQMGYDGKMTIHPRQVEPAQRAFAPSAEEIEQAQRILAAYAEQQAAGVGAFALDGRMVDMPVVRAAENVTARAAAAGLISGE